MSVQDKAVVNTDGSVYPNFTREDYKIEDRPVSYQRRGMGKFGLTRRPMLDAERMTICMLKGKGLTLAEIGEKLRRSPDSVKSVLKQAELAAQKMGLNFDWREDVREKAVYALRAGLTCETDPYKAAGLGVQALKGLGDFEADSNVNIAAMLSAVPDNMRERYITIEAEPNLISSGGDGGEEK